MDANLALYIVRYYGELMSTQEKWVCRHLQTTMVLTRGRSDPGAQQEAKNRAGVPREMLSDDPEVLRLAEGGMEEFLEQTATRILEQHGEKILLNKCPRCGALAKTPKARQCRFCGHDWHDLPR